MEEFLPEVLALFVYYRIVLEVELTGCVKILSQLEEKVLNTRPVMLYYCCLHCEAMNVFEQQNDTIYTDLFIIMLKSFLW